MTTEQTWKDKRRGIPLMPQENLDQEIDGAMTDFFERFSREFIRNGIAAYLYAREVAKPRGVNEDAGPDYEQMAQAAKELAETAAPYLLDALGFGVPAQVREEQPISHVMAEDTE